MENNTIAKQRNFKYDNIKAILIFLVIFGHVLRPIIKTNIDAKLVYMAIYTFHMPAFIYVMGMFSRPKKNKIWLFLSLYAIFQLLYTPFLHYLFGNPMKLTFIRPQWSLWYLIAAAAYTSLTFILPKKLSSTKSIICVFITSAIALLAGFCPWIDQPLALSRIIAFFPFFAAGKYGFFKPVEKKTHIKWLWLFVALSLTVAYIFWSKGNYNDLYRASGYVVTRCGWHLRAIAMVAAFCWIKTLLLFIPNKNIPFVTTIGKRTLPIYLMHGFIVKLFDCYCDTQYSILIAFVTSSLILVLCVSAAMLFSKLKNQVARKTSKKDKNAI